MQGDVVQILSVWGTKLVEYSYDAWGNYSVVYSHSSYGDLAEINPIRYRSYFYDFETGFYYLQSRYYDPQVRRFISSDSYVNANGDFIGFNMYAYCSNNSVNYVDVIGTNAEALKLWSSSMWWLCGADTVLPIGDIIYISGIVILGIYTTVSIAQEIASPISFEDEEKTESNIPNIPYPGDDPTKKPDDDYEWKGEKPEGGKKGTWANDKTGEQLHPDLDHPKPVGPHWDYTDGSKPKKWWRIFPDGTILPKK